MTFSGTFNRTLWPADEPRVAEIGREMYETGDYIVPTLGPYELGSIDNKNLTDHSKTKLQPFLEKPPLYWWVMTVFFRIFGVSDVSAHATSSFAALLILLLVYDLTRRLSDPQTGVLSALIMSTVFSIMIENQRVIVDPYVALFGITGYWGFVYAMFLPAGSHNKLQDTSDSHNKLQDTSDSHDKLQDTSDSHDRWRDRPKFFGVMTLYIAAGLSFLTKGPVGVALIAGPIVLTILFTRKLNFFKTWAHPPGIILFLMLCAFWPLMLYIKGGRALSDQFLLNNILYRFIPAPAGSNIPYLGHHHSVFYYLQFIPQFFQPWTLCIPAMILALWKKRLPKNWNRSAICFLALIPLTGILMLSIPSTKRKLYMLPLLAPFSCALGTWLSALWSRGQDTKLDRLTEIVYIIASPFAPLAAGVYILLLATGSRVLHVPEGFNPQYPAWLYAAFVFFSLLIFAGAVLAFKQWKKRGRNVPILILLLLLVTGLTYNLVINSFMEPQKNLSRMPMDLVRMNAFERNLVSFSPTETLKSIVPFYSGHFLEYTSSSQTLREILKKKPSTLILLYNRATKKPDKDLMEQFHLVKEWSAKGNRKYHLYEYINKSSSTAEKQGTKENQGTK